MSLWSADPTAAFERLAAEFRQPDLRKIKTADDWQRKQVSMRAEIPRAPTGAWAKKVTGYFASTEFEAHKAILEDIIVSHSARANYYIKLGGKSPLINKLPTELHYNIFPPTYLIQPFPTHSFILWADCWDKPNRATFYGLRAQPAITRVCRAIRSEALPAFYHEHEFLFDLIHDAIFLEPAADHRIRRFIHNVGESNLRLIRRLRFRVGGSQNTEDEGHGIVIEIGDTHKHNNHKDDPLTRWERLTDAGAERTVWICKAKVITHQTVREALDEALKGFKRLRKDDGLSTSAAIIHFLDYFRMLHSENRR